MFTCLDCLIKVLVDSSTWISAVRSAGLGRRLVGRASQDSAATGRLSLDEALTTATPSRASEDSPLAFFWCLHL